MWVDFNDIKDGRLTVLQAHATVEIIGVGQTLTVGDRAGNRCGAIVVGLNENVANLRLVLDTLVRAPRIADLVAYAPLDPGERMRGGIRYGEADLTVERAGRYQISAQLTEDPSALASATMVEAMQQQIDRVYLNGQEHTNPMQRAHTEPLAGCPWCVDQTRAEDLYKRMCERWPDEWPTLTVFEARVLCARGDVARSKS